MGSRPSRPDADRSSYWWQYPGIVREDRGVPGREGRLGTGSDIVKVLGIVPARRGSKRLPGKNIKPLQGKPLCQWMIEVSLAARRLDRVIVSSDDEQVLQIARELNP